MPKLLHSCDKTPFQLIHSPHPCRPSSIGRHSKLVHPLGPTESCQQVDSCHIRSHSLSSKLTSISTKLGVGSSPFSHQPVPKAPVALPGFTKNLPSISYASNRCVPPHNSTSTSICRAAINSASASPGGAIVCPCVKPMRNEPCVTTFESARFGASTSKSPFTICRSGAMLRRNSKVSLSVRLPRQRIWPILPGVRSFLN